MDIKKDKYIILEIIPTGYKNNNGTIVQLCALKIDGLKLIDRFDYRLTDEALPIKKFKEWIDYDNHLFTYVNSSEEMLNKFSEFISDIPLLIIDNDYTKDYFSHLDNKIENILDYLEVECDDYVIDKLINTYNLQPSNHIVDILYEALMMKY